jgi:putative ABC transport system permease protein
MAIGAKSWDIRLQFLAEALILSLIGGIIGVIFGIAGVYILPLLTSISAELSSFYVILPFSFSGIVGLAFGFFPAYKASLLNPINALRYE